MVTDKTSMDSTDKTSKTSVNASLVTDKTGMNSTEKTSIGSGPTVKTKDNTTEDADNLKKSNAGSNVSKYLLSMHSVLKV